MIYQTSLLHKFNISFLLRQLPNKVEVHDLKDVKYAVLVKLKQVLIANLQSVVYLALLAAMSMRVWITCHVSADFKKSSFQFTCLQHMESYYNSMHTTCHQVYTVSIRKRLIHYTRSDLLFSLTALCLLFQLSSV